MKKKMIIMAVGIFLVSNLFGCGDAGVNINDIISEKSSTFAKAQAEQKTSEKKGKLTIDNKDIDKLQDESSQENKKTVNVVEVNADNSQDNTKNNLQDSSEPVVNNNTEEYLNENKEKNNESINESECDNNSYQEESVCETKKLSEEDAMNILNNSVKTEKYEVEINHNNFIYEGREYYQYLINYDDITSQYSLIVDKETGKIKCYRVDGYVCDFEGSMFSKDYDESIKKVYDWNGEYYLKDGDGMLNISKTDEDSFEFNIYGNENDKSLEKIVAEAKTQDNIGNYIYDNGEVLNFIIGNGYIEVNRFNTSGETVFHGIYWPK